MRRLAIVALLGTVLLAVAPTAASAEESREGGYSFNDATQLTGPGTVEQDLVVGETLFWQIDLKPGQTLKVSSTTVFGDDYVPDLSLNVQYHLLTIYLPTRKAASCLGDGPTSVNQGDITGTVTLACDSGVIGDGTSTDEWAEPGTYYITVATTHPAENVRGLVKPLTLEVDVEGTARPEAELEYDPGEPVAGAVVPTAPPPPKPKPKEGGDERQAGDSDQLASGMAGVLVPVGAGVVGCVLGGAVGFAVRRSRSNGSPPPSPPAGPPANPPWPGGPPPGQYGGPNTPPWQPPARPSGPPGRPPPPPPPAAPPGWQPRPRR